MLYKTQRVTRLQEGPVKLKKSGLTKCNTTGANSMGKHHYFSESVTLDNQT